MINLLRLKSIVHTRSTYLALHTSVAKFTNRDDNRIKVDTNTLRKCLEETPKDLVPKQSLAVKTWVMIYYRRFTGAYDEISGWREVREADEEVDKSATKLNTCRLRKRTLAKDLLEIRQNIQSADNEVHATDPGNPRYLQLAQSRFELIQKERDKEDQFRFVDSEEREQFSQLVESMIRAKDKDRIHKESTRHISFLSKLIYGLLFPFILCIVGYGGGPPMVKNVKEIIEKRKQKKQKKEGWKDYFWRHSSSAAGYIAMPFTWTYKSCKNLGVDTYNWFRKPGKADE